MERIRRAVAGGTVELRVAELVPLAKAIVDSNTEVTIPFMMLETVRNVIGERQKCADMYAAKSTQRTGSISKDDRSHQHFIGVLEQVLDTLASANTPTVFFGPKRTARMVHQVSKATPEDQLFNKFGGLEVEEAAELEMTSSPEKASPALDLTKTKFSTDEEDDDANFEVWCHLQDMAEVRLFVDDTWTQYKCGEVSFILASAVTEAAICLLKCCDDAFVASNPTLSTHRKVLEHLGFTLVYIDEV